MKIQRLAAAITAVNLSRTGTTYALRIVAQVARGPGMWTNPSFESSFPSE
jgi:hypothetical protein